jgi:hypothetical protein
MSELKACPFCGLIIHDPNGIEKTCECPNDMDHMSRALWNTRPIEDVLRSENERMQKEVVASRNFIEDILGRATKSQLRAIAPFHAKYRSALSGEPTVQSLFEKKRSHEEDMDFINKINGD